MNYKDYILLGLSVNVITINVRGNMKEIVGFDIFN